MKKILLIVFLLSFNSSLFSQYSNEFENACDITNRYLLLPVMPEFEGGIDKLIDLVNSELEINKGLKGHLHLRFLVNCKGEASGFTIYDGLNDEFDKKLISLFEKHQSWSAGKSNNEEVDCLYALQLRIKHGMIK